MSNKKKLGQYFTPDFVADFMIDLSASPKSARVLEPSCGEGIFLKLLYEKGFKNNIGYEIDNSLKPITETPIIYKSFIQEEFSERFDLIIGNPPYIRWKNLDPDLKEELYSNALWSTYFNSLSDYLCIFILKSVEILRTGGELIFITPEYWFNTKNSQILRDYLVKNGYFTDIFHFNETPIFENVSSSFVIFKYVKSSEKKQNVPNIRIAKHHSASRLTKTTLDHMRDGVPDESIVRFERRQFPLRNHWILAPNEIEEELMAYEKSCRFRESTTLFPEEYEFSTVGDIADIANGMVSGLDNAFKLPDEIDLSEKEMAATIRVLKAKSLSRYVHGSENRYMFVNGTVLSEMELKREFSRFYELLQPFKTNLEKRYNYNRAIPYWEWVFPRSYASFNTDKKRIFVPCKERISHKNYFRFAYVSEKIFPTQDVTAIMLKPDVKESIYYLLAVLNSRQVFDWLRYKGVVKGNIVEFSEKPLSSIPVRKIDWDNSSEVLEHDRIVERVKKYIQNPSDEILNEIQNHINVLLR